MYQDPTPVPRDRAPGDDLAKQLGGSGARAKGGRSLVVVKSKTALDASSLDAGSMMLEYVERGQAGVTRCFEALRAKAPAAKGELVLRFTVDKQGAVVDPQVTGFHADVTLCVQEAMPRWKFTAPNRPTRFELVLNLVIEQLPTVHPQESEKKSIPPRIRAERLRKLTNRRSSIVLMTDGVRLETPRRAARV